MAIEIQVSSIEELNSRIGGGRTRDASLQKFADALGQLKDGQTLRILSANEAEMKKSFGAIRRYALQDYAQSKLITHDLKSRNNPTDGSIHLFWTPIRVVTEDSTSAEKTKAGNGKRGRPRKNAEPVNE
jgi:hypothetical protein